MIFKGCGRRKLGPNASIASASKSLKKVRSAGRGGTILERRPSGILAYQVAPSSSGTPRPVGGDSAQAFSTECLLGSASSEPGLEGSIGQEQTDSANGEVNTAKEMPRTLSDRIPARANGIAEPQALEAQGQMLTFRTVEALATWTVRRHQGQPQKISHFGEWIAR